MVLVDIDKKELINLVKSRQHQDIKKVLKSWGGGVLGQIEEVSIDLSGNYRSLVKKMLPNAVIVADRFPVMKLVNADLNRARNKEKRAIEFLKNFTEKEKLQEIWKSSKYALLKPEENLTKKQILKFKELNKALPNLTKLHAEKEAFREIFERATSWGDGVLNLSKWLKNSHDIFQDSIGRIGRWFGEISNYFESRTTSGVVEGISNRLKLIKRSGYGFRNFENFRLRCLICWHLSPRHTLTGKSFWYESSENINT